MRWDRKKSPFFPNEHTHTNEAGARLNAQSVVEGLKALPDCDLDNFLAFAKTSRETGRKPFPPVNSHERVINSLYPSFSHFSIRSARPAVAERSRCAWFWWAIRRFASKHPIHSIAVGENS